MEITRLSTFPQHKWLISINSYLIWSFWMMQSLFWYSIWHSSKSSSLIWLRERSVTNKTGCTSCWIWDSKQSNSNWSMIPQFAKNNANIIMIVSELALKKVKWYVYSIWTSLKKIAQWDQRLTWDILDKASYIWQT